MALDFMFFLNSALLGVGLAMDAFSVSLANGLGEPKMSVRKMCGIAFCYAFFQYAMPMAGWICVHSLLGAFEVFQNFIPWIALVLLLFIGGKMIFESVKENKSSENVDEDRPKEEISKLTFPSLIVQGIATSIDALSVGFTTASYKFFMANLSAVIIAAVTFVICMCGVAIGKKAGSKLAGKAGIFGGVILIIIGIEIFVKGMIG